MDGLNVVIGPHTSFIVLVLFLVVALLPLLRLLLLQSTCVVRL